ncbi:hypothetical protein MTR67_034664 [Solanum verrucosum]|uniref:Uncharacterized protein n=1 Tax=Solanum verrucosum TaxID=315347 RepID=A0AAF0U8Z2_SOLVR|nr:hypothetical protein MTR67_034664 [Solanum verrucosum]
MVVNISKCYTQILLTLQSFKALKSRLVPLISLALHPSLFVHLFSTFQLLGMIFIWYSIIFTIVTLEISY